MSSFILLAILLGPLVVLSLLKVNAVFVYLSLCMGAVVTEFASNNKLLNSFVSNTNVINKYINNNSDIKLALLLIPPVLTTIFMIRTAKTHKLSLNMFGALSVGLLAIFLVVPILPPGLQDSALKSPIWTNIVSYRGLIVGACSILILVMLLLQRSKLAHSSHHVHNKHEKS